MNDQTTTRDRSQARAAQAVMWTAVAVAMTGAVLWALGRLGLLAPIMAGAAAVVALTAGPVLKARSLRSGPRP